MPAIANCSFCSSPAQYYCKSCKRLLCIDHIIITNTVYYCSKCKQECFDSTCPNCGSDTVFSKHESVQQCDWCKSTDVEDALLYHQQLPQLIFSSFSLINSKLSKIWDLTQKYLTLVDSVFQMRSARIMLFREIEDELTLLRGKISTFIDHLTKFENETFKMVDEKLKAIGYMRYTNLNNIERAEEILNLLRRRLDLLDSTLQNKTSSINCDFDKLNHKVDFVHFQLKLLKKIHTFLPNHEDEDLISIIPHVWIRKNKNLPKKYLVTLTNRNLYLFRERGLFDVKLKFKEAISLSFIKQKRYGKTLLTHKRFLFKTSLDKYSLFGFDDSIRQFSTYFNIIEDYIDFSIHKSSIIQDLQHYSLTITELKTNIQRNLNHFRAFLLNKRELKRELFYKEVQDARFNKLFEQLLAVERKINRLNESRRYGTTASRGIDGLLRKLTHEYNRLKEQIEEIRGQKETEEDFWGF
ncbi:MAG: hypothetical protein ACTSX6_04350 [Candidatus Heimdallarchaeaceae archaeon]